MAIAVGRTLLATWMVFLETRHIVDVVVYDDQEISGLIMGGNVLRGEGLGHDVDGVR